MTSPKPVEVSWQSPEDVAAKVHAAYGNIAFLHSTMQLSFSGQHSYLAFDEAEVVEADNFAALEDKLKRGKWFGYIGYELAHDLEKLPKTRASAITNPPLRMARYHTIIHWDHTQQCMTIASDNGFDLGDLDDVTTEQQQPAVTTLSSPMTRQDYLDKVQSLIDAIHAGDIFQANLTRKFIGELAETPNALALFLQLCELSPSPFSALFTFGDSAIISSSPESFLSIDETGHVSTRPIKGSLSADEKKDILLQSSKDRAENLMIVDLMRNDLSRVCQAGSIHVDALYEIQSYATIHQMSSTISGQLREDANALDCIKACFPPGSMTGAPKIKAMELCAELEGLQRGVYSGALGWLDADGSAELSVVIRTLLLQGNQFEFQVGGAIVADSTPEKEWQETLVKATAIRELLGISQQQLKEI